ncbi:hypothetical protein ACFFIS_05700 [Virgibacillus soli]
MYKRILLLFFAITLFQTSVLAQQQVPPFEQFYEDMDYKPIDLAIKECEANFNKKPILPSIIPPVPFTHNLGRCDKNKDWLEIKFFNEELPENHYKLDIFLDKDRIAVEEVSIKKTYVLENGETAFLVDMDEHFDTFIFNANNWQYVLSIDKRITGQVPPTILKNIANSIHTR